MNLINWWKYNLKKKIITIDGPAASGKGKIAKYIKKNGNLNT